MRMLAFVLVLLLCAQACALSPTTGRELLGAPIAPVVVSIGLAEGEGKTAGRGKAQPWGIQHADVVYESLLAKHGSTRLTCLYHDALVNGVNAEAGPVRSARNAQAVLAKEWNGVLVYSGATAGNRHGAPKIAELTTPYFAAVDSRIQPYTVRLKSQGIRKVKAPNNLSLNVSGLGEWACGDFKGAGLLFDSEPWEAETPIVSEIHMDWGYAPYQSYYIYEGTHHRYLRFHRKSPAMTWFSASGTEQEQIAFSNLIIQFVEYDWLDGNGWLPSPRLEKRGKAMVFSRGRMKEGTWSYEGRTIFLDQNGQEISLVPGTTYVALFPQNCGKIELK